MRRIDQSTAYALTVLMVQSSDHITGLTGATLTITASYAGGAYASITPTVTELGNGNYSLALTAAHTANLGDLALHITAASGDPVDVYSQVLAPIPTATQNAAAVSAAVPDVNVKTVLGGPLKGDGSDAHPWGPA
jgi:hypothetical protein